MPDADPLLLMAIMECIERVSANGVHDNDNEAMWLRRRAVIHRIFFAALATEETRHLVPPIPPSP